MYVHGINQILYSRKLTEKKLTQLPNFALNFRMKLARLQQIDFEMYEINENVRHCSIW